MASKHDPLDSAGYGKRSRRSRAIALGYDPEKDLAPRILASGQGVIAEQIVNIARANGILIRDDPVLTAALSNVAVGDLVPPELYALVAEVLAYVYRLKDRQSFR
jgi:flagellar biosynthesis protein